MKKTIKQKKKTKNVNKNRKKKRTQKYGGNNEKNDIECPVCYLDEKELSEANIPMGQLISCDSTSKCNHLLCKKCFDKLVFQPETNKKKCPLCNRSICSFKYDETTYSPTREAQYIRQTLDILGPDWSLYDDGKKII